MIYKRGWLKTISRYDLKKLLEAEGVADVNKVVRILKGDDWESEGPFHIVDRAWFPRDEVKFWQRLNRLWFVPLYLLTVPFQWLFRGCVGFNNDSKTAKLIAKLTGLE